MLFIILLYEYIFYQNTFQHFINLQYFVSGWDNSKENYINCNLCSMSNCIQILKLKPDLESFMMHNIEQFTCEENLDFIFQCKPSDDEFETNEICEIQKLIERKIKLDEIGIEDKDVTHDITLIEKEESKKNNYDQNS